MQQKHFNSDSIYVMELWMIFKNSFYFSDSKICSVMNMYSFSDGKQIQYILYF